MWLSKRLGEYYSRLYVRFGQELFTFNEAADALSLDKNSLSVAFSKLHSKRALLIFNREKPRVYRLLDPENFVFLASGTVKNFDRIRQERYLKLILDCIRAVKKTLELGSFAVYGSVARGDATDRSDVDILIISDSLKGSLGARIEELLPVEYMLAEELKWLRERGTYTPLSFYPLKKNEAKMLPLLFLDLTEEAVILYDEGCFLESLLLDLKARLLRCGAKKFTVDMKWYWD
ncbi:MAG: nucleotidyltransferase family protein, partial [Nitrososphaerales archaeon]